MAAKDGMREELRVVVLPVICKGLDENLHITTKAKEETKGQLALSMVGRFGHEGGGLADNSLHNDLDTATEAEDEMKGPSFWIL